MYRSRGGGRANVENGDNYVALVNATNGDNYVALINLTNGDNYVAYMINVTYRLKLR